MSSAGSKHLPQKKLFRGSQGRPAPSPGSRRGTAGPDTSPGRSSLRAAPPPLLRGGERSGAGAAGPAGACRARGRSRRTCSCSRRRRLRRGRSLPRGQAAVRPASRRRQRRLLRGGLCRPVPGALLLAAAAAAPPPQGGGLEAGPLPPATGHGGRCSGAASPRPPPAPPLWRGPRRLPADWLRQRRLQHPLAPLAEGQVADAGSRRRPLAAVLPPCRLCLPLPAASPPSPLSAVPLCAPSSLLRCSLPSSLGFLPSCLPCSLPSSSLFLLSSLLLSFSASFSLQVLQRSAGSVSLKETQTGVNHYSPARELKLAKRGLQKPELVVKKLT